MPGRGAGPESSNRAPWSAGGVGGWRVRGGCGSRRPGSVFPRPGGAGLGGEFRVGQDGAAQGRVAAAFQFHAGRQQPRYQSWVGCQLQRGRWRSSLADNARAVGCRRPGGVPGGRGSEQASRRRRCRGLRRGSGRRAAGTSGSDSALSFAGFPPVGAAAGGCSLAGVPRRGRGRGRGCGRGQHQGAQGFRRGQSTAPTARTRHRPRQRVVKPMSGRRLTGPSIPPHPAPPPAAAPAGRSGYAGCRGFPTGLGGDPAGHRVGAARGGGTDCGRGGAGGEHGGEVPGSGAVLGSAGAVLVGGDSGNSRYGGTCTGRLLGLSGEGDGLWLLAAAWVPSGWAAPEGGPGWPSTQPAAGPGAGRACLGVMAGAAAPGPRRPRSGCPGRCGPRRPGAADRRRRVGRRSGTGAGRRGSPRAPLAGPGRRQRQHRPGTARRCPADGRRVLVPVLAGHQGTGRGPGRDHRRRGARRRRRGSSWWWWTSAGDGRPCGPSPGNATGSWSCCRPRLRAAVAAARLVQELPPVETVLVVRASPGVALDGPLIAESVGLPLHGIMPEIRGLAAATELGRLLDAGGRRTFSVSPRRSLVARGPGSVSATGRRTGRNRRSARQLRAPPGAGMGRRDAARRTRVRHGRRRPVTPSGWPRPSRPAAGCLAPPVPWPRSRASARN